MNAISPRLIFDDSTPTFPNGSPAVSSEANAALPLHPFSTLDIDQGMTKIVSLMQGPSRVPTQAAVELASEWVYLTFERANKLGNWCRPHITSTEAGEVVFEGGIEVAI
jgi:hypothetical protein